MDIAKKVQEDIEARAKLGKKKYGARLASYSRENGKTPFENMYEEILDMAMYLKQHLVENENLEAQAARPGPREYPTPKLDKVRKEIIELHGQGYHTSAIARELKQPFTCMQQWIKKLGLTPNPSGKHSPGYVQRGKSMNGKPKKYQLLTPKEQNEKLKEERDERQNAAILSGPDGRVSGEGSDAN